jgi:hypothetical protein
MIERVPHQECDVDVAVAARLVSLDGSDNLLSVTR